MPDNRNTRIDSPDSISDPILDEWIDHDEGVRVIQRASGFEYVDWPDAEPTA